MIFFLAYPSYATPEHDAVNAAARAFYEQQGWDKMINDYLGKYERDLTPKQRKWGGVLVYIIDAVNRQEVRFVWRFP